MVRCEITVTRAETGDCASLAAIDSLSNSGSWSEKALLQMLQSPSVLLLAAKTADEAVGFMVCEEQGDLLAVDELAVHPQKRRLGAGSALMRAAEEHARQQGIASLTLEVRQQNSTAVAFYEAMGFAVAGVRKNLYRDPDDNGIVMIKLLNED